MHKRQIKHLQRSCSFPPWAPVAGCSEAPGSSAALHKQHMSVNHIHQDPLTPSNTRTRLHKRLSTRSQILRGSHVNLISEESECFQSCNRSKQIKREEVFTSSRLPQTSGRHTERGHRRVKLLLEDHDVQTHAKARDDDDDDEQINETMTWSIYSPELLPG